MGRASKSVPEKLTDTTPEQIGLEDPPKYSFGPKGSLLADHCADQRHPHWAGSSGVLSLTFIPKDFFARDWGRGDNHFRDLRRNSETFRCVGDRSSCAVKSRPNSSLY